MLVGNNASNEIRQAEMMAAIQLRTHQILKLLFAQIESAPTASPISIIIFHHHFTVGKPLYASISVDEKFDLISILKWECPAGEKVRSSNSSGRVADLRSSLHIGGPPGSWWCGRHGLGLIRLVWNNSRSRLVGLNEKNIYKYANESCSWLAGSSTKFLAWN